MKGLRGDRREREEEVRGNERGGVEVRECGRRR